jgi:hypothetical protein
MAGVAGDRRNSSSSRAHGIQPTRRSERAFRDHGGGG